MTDEIERLRIQKEEAEATADAAYARAAEKMKGILDAEQEELDAALEEALEAREEAYAAGRAYCEAVRTHWPASDDTAAP